MSSTRQLHLGSGKRYIPEFIRIGFDNYQHIKNRANISLQRAKNILHEEGLASFIKSALLFFVNFFFSFSTCYIYENRLDRVEFPLPKIENFCLKIISAPEHIDKLFAEGFDFSSDSNMENFKRRLNKGGILFYVFVEKKLVHTNWIAMSKKANFDPFPFKIDWRDEACLGPSYTIPEYRRRGINSFVYSKMFQLLMEKGRSRAKFTIAKSNIAHQKSQAKIGSEIIGEGKLFKILLWKFWIEKPTKGVKQ